jgi:hypothetical protein
MAERYWVPGGSGIWSGANNWASTSGGSTSGVAPAAGDNVYFDGNSGNPVVVVQASVTLGNFQLLGSCSVDLGQNLTLSGDLTINRGSFSAGAFNLNASKLIISGSLGKTFNQGSGTHTFSGAGTTISVTGSNVNNNRDTATVILSSPTASIVWTDAVFGASFFHNLTFSSTAQTETSIFTNNNFSIFGTFTIAGRATPGINHFTMYSNLYVQGTLTLSQGASAACRTFIKSDIIGVRRTFTVANSFTATNDIDFRDVAMNAPTTITASRFGNCGGNLGITFPAAKTVYYTNNTSTVGASWGEAGTGNWSPSAFVGQDPNMFPLAQDTAVFASTNSPPNLETVTINDRYNIGNLDMQARTSNIMGLQLGTQGATIYGSIVVGEFVAYYTAGSNPCVFAGRTTQNISNVGLTSQIQISWPININSPGGTVVLQKAFRSGVSYNVDIINGTLNLNGFTATFGGHINISGTNNRGVNFGSNGILDIGSNSNSSIAWDASVSTNLTTSGTGTIIISRITGSPAASKSFYGGGVTYPNIKIASDVLDNGFTIFGSNRFFGASTNGTCSPSNLGLFFEAGTTNEFTTFNLSGVSGGVIKLGSTTTTQANLVKYTPWNVGANSTNVVGNTGLSFTAGGGIDYLSISYINGVGGATGNFLAFF